MDVRLPDGTVIQGVPDNITKAELTAKLAKNGYDVSKLSTTSTPQPSQQDAPWTITSVGAGLGKGFGDIMLGAQNLVGKGLQKVGEAVTPDQQSVSGLISGKKDRGLIQSAGDWLVDDAASGRAKLDAENASYKTAHPIANGLGEVGGNVVGTLPVGGVLASGVRAAAPVLTRAGASAPLLARLANSVETGGFRSGATAATTTGQRLADLAMRSTGGAITGGTSAALMNPDSVDTGAVVGAALPPGLSATGKAIGYAGRGLYALAQPFTKAGQDRLAGSIINKFATDGPIALDVAEHVPGSQPTLAEATGNAGIARLQNATRDLKPNLFTDREASNAAARNAMFDQVAGDAGKLDASKALRAQTAGDLYSDALKTDISTNMTPDIQNEVTQLLNRPSIKDARKTAERWALERGEQADVGGSMAGLHDMKMALDDQISEAVRAGKGGEAKALSNTKDKLLGVMEKLSPDYQQARITYSEMSKPINAMETLQGLRLTDAQGNMTLSKVQNAIDGLEKRMAQSGTDPAKALTTDQLNTLKSIRDDLLRKSRAGAGKSAGSNTFQNIATDNVIASLLPGKAGEIVGNKVGGVAGQLGRLMYSGPNEAVRDRLAELMLDPGAAKAAMESANTPLLQQLAWPEVSALQNTGKPLLQSLYRAAPVEQARSR